MCNLGPGEGEPHQEACPLYVAPVPAGFLSENADAFVQAADKLDKGVILAAVSACKAVHDAADANPDNAKLQEVAEAEDAAVAAAAAPVDEALALYAEVPPDERDTEKVAAAYSHFVLRRFS